jgi:hypothetical protein
MRIMNYEVDMITEKYTRCPGHDPYSEISQQIHEDYRKQSLHIAISAYNTVYM